MALLGCINNVNAKYFQYLYIEANEGIASGGHVAVQFADTIYHYQYSNGMTRLAKENAEDVDFNYRYLQNRSLHVADIEVSEADFSLLQDYFSRQFWDQDRQFKRLQALQNDRLLLEWFLTLKNKTHAATTNPDLALPAAGLFYSASNFSHTAAINGNCHSEEAAGNVLTRLRQQIEQQYGTHFLSQRKSRLQQTLLSLSIPGSENLNTLAQYSFSQRYIDTVNSLLAVQVLQESRPLTAVACNTLAAPDGQLHAGQRQALQSYQQRLFHSAQSLLISKRPDWAQALFVTLARLVVTEQSLQTGNWVFLDDFSPQATVIATETYRNQAAEMQQQYVIAEQRWHQHWQAVTTNPVLNDLDYTELELAANRYHEWQTSQTLHSLRYQGQQPLPLKTLNLPAWSMPAASSAQMQQGLQSLQSSIPRITAELEQQYAYDLVSRNCVTEIFRSINQALGETTEQHLGKRIDPDLNFIPYTAFASVLRHYPVKHTQTLASWRQQQLAKQYEQTFAPWVFAREANVLTAELYRYNPDDAAFMFFTDDSLLLRPLFGTFNILTGLGQSLWGLLQLPVDQGSTLHKGTRGLLMSLPELAFINIRKGSYKFISADKLPGAVSPP